MFLRQYGGPMGRQTVRITPGSRSAYLPYKRSSVISSSSANMFSRRGSDDSSISDFNKPSASRQYGRGMPEYKVQANKAGQMKLVRVKQRDNMTRDAVAKWVFKNQQAQEQSMMDASGQALRSSSKSKHGMRSSKQDSMSKVMRMKALKAQGNIRTKSMMERSKRRDNRQRVSEYEDSGSSSS
ncbi:hypothetical protein PoB_003665100 [Plakobranchus ocellatus]|uniref:Uncharacterized protein n=1 Tax=Plakobranchus ocellatus TaxID=259542 RepID=A0AAV4APQ7_9GAST|nr:hypothetical protein PoB_003665100 [Plakobranchus ocellatus]